MRVGRPCFPILSYTERDARRKRQQAGRKKHERKRPPTPPRTTGKTPGKHGKGNPPTQREETPPRRWEEMTNIEPRNKMLYSFRPVTWSSGHLGRRKQGQREHNEPLRGLASTDVEQILHTKFRIKKKHLCDIVDHLQGSFGPFGPKSEKYLESGSPGPLGPRLSKKPETIEH